MTDRTPRKRLTAEMITALTAVIIGVAAVGVSLYETSLISKQLKGSAWPNIEGGFSHNEQGFRYFIANSGVGPARIRYAEITVDGVAVADWGEFFEHLDLDVGRYVTSYLAGGALSPGAVREVLILDPSQPVDELFSLPPTNRDDP